MGIDVLISSSVPFYINFFSQSQFTKRIYEASGEDAPEASETLLQEGSANTRVIAIRLWYLESLLQGYISV